MRLGATVYVVDNHPSIGDTICDPLEDQGYSVECFADGRAFSEAIRPATMSCLVIDAQMPEITGTDVLSKLRDCGIWIPATMMSGHGDLDMAVDVMKAGAVEFMTKPFSQAVLLAKVKAAMAPAMTCDGSLSIRKRAVVGTASLTARQREILDLVVVWQPSKNIAANLHIGQRSVDNHRALICRKTGSEEIFSQFIQTPLCARCARHA